MNVGEYVCVRAVSQGDHVAGMLAVAVASSRTLEVLDLESTGLTNQSAQVRHLHVWGRPGGGGGELARVSVDVTKGWQAGVKEATLTEFILFHTLFYPRPCWTW